jgi:CheY-like chemotaxis protein/HPt (histidine-containing phosphotransfer) domain-containing protein
VISEPGKGSTFWFTARLARRSQATVMRKESSVDLRGLRVLAVDDNQTNREILQSQLCNWSLRADIAVDASEAIGMLQTASEAGDPYRFAILDMHMPGTDGMQLAAAIKADPRTREVILISLSSISDQIKKEQMNAHGFAACLTKPVLPSQLYDTIVNSLAADEANENAATEAVAPPAARLDGVRVLLAEDNEVNRLVATELLQLVGCICTVAVNGQEAVDCALREEFDVILMDCQMPILDGFEATRRIREAEKQAGKMHHRMIVALTANAIKGDRELCLAAGMDDYVTKPIEPDVLMRTIGSLLPEARLAELAASGGKENCTTESGATPEKSGAPIPVDLESLQRRCVNNRKLAAKTLRLFDSGIDRDLSALTRSISEGDPKAIAAAAHKIKGAAANVSAESVRKAAAELEALGRNDALSQSQAALDLLQQEISHFRDYLSTALEQLTANEAGTITAAESAQTQASLALHPGLDLGH